MNNGKRDADFHDSTYDTGDLERKEIFLGKIADCDVRYERGSGSNLRSYALASPKVPQPALYQPDEAEKLMKMGVEERMKVRISEHYNAMVTGGYGMPPSKPLANLVTARGEEVSDLDGEIDPSNQLSYSPVAGLLHKYEMALLYVAKTCSAHCRYCYRSDLFTGISGKQLAKSQEVRDYIMRHNEAVLENEGCHPESGHPELREVLLSGGDPMVLSNKKLATWLVDLAEAGIRRIRIGTKELAFFPERFDDAFFSMIDYFHQYYPDVRLTFSVHFTHPDEFLLRDSEGSYIDNEASGYVWLSMVDNAVVRLNKRRHFITLENQTPIIRDVNDDAEILRTLQRELYAHGIGNHYFFQCRLIRGFKAFAIPVEETFQIFAESKKGLSGIEAHSRLVMSTEQGKVEIIGVSGEKGQTDEGMIVFRLLRSPATAESLGHIIMARRNSKAFWVDDYKDRVIEQTEGFMIESH
ncbi:MAG: hypothetical protein AAF984_02400 [Verrucomicrobiota bacterium]